MSSFKDLIRADVNILFRIQDFCRSNPSFDNFMKNIVSKYPHKDIVLVVYLVSIFALVELGHNHFWLCIINLSVAFFIRKIIAAKRPVEYNRALMPITDIAAESYGFPSLESHMSVVVLGHLVVSYSAPFLLLPSLAVAGLIGFSRLYARSRFVHQIVGSWATGLFGLYIGLKLCKSFNFDRMVRKNYTFCLMVSLGGLFCHFMLCAENNDSRIMYLSRTEFIRVISEIISPPADARDDPARLEAFEDDGGDGEGEGEGDSHRVRFLPPVMEGAPARKRKNQNKRDSFFFLQRSLERRSGRPTTLDGSNVL